MATPPRPSPAEREAALRRIHARRRAAGDDHPLALSDDPREVLAYLRKRGRAGLVADETGDDVVDALTLTLGLWWETVEFEVFLLEAAEALNRNRRAVGAVLGLTSGQSLVNRRTRRRAMLSPDRAPAADPPHETDSDGRIRNLAVALVARRGDLPTEVAEDLYFDVLADRVPEWPAGQPPRAGVIGALQFVLAQLVEQVPDDSPLRELVDAGVALVGIPDRLSHTDEWKQSIHEA